MIDDYSKNDLGHYNEAEKWSIYKIQAVEDTTGKLNIEKDQKAAYW